MCGIAGAIGTLDPEVLGAVERAAEFQNHRGPDASGSWKHRDADGRGAAFAHRRLAIIDLSDAGRQPMLDPDTGNVVCFNGEIYNYREVRAELASRGQRFRTGTDTEVILKAWAAWGFEALPRLRGMFAFALWDAERRETVLVRDRLGIKPLYLSRIERPGGGQALLFASEVRALLAGGLVESRLDPLGAATYLWNGFVVSPRTLVSGVEELAAGTLRVFDDRGSLRSERRWWELPASETGGDIEALRAALEEAVRIRLISDVPLGIFLSGGIDSSAVAALAARAGGDPPRTFTVGFDESDWDESQHAEAVARELGTEHTRVPLSADAFRGHLDDALRSLDQPTFDGVNSYFVSRAVREAGLTVALSGAGGDELFGGYRSFRDLPRAARWTAPLAGLPAPWLRSLGRTLGAARRGGGSGLPPQTRWGKLGDLLTAGGRMLDAYQVAYALFTRDFLSELSQRALDEETPLGLPRARREELSRVAADPSVLHAVSLLELSLFLGERLLRDTDSVSMAVSLEVRLPLIDHEVVEAAARLPDPVRFAPLGRKEALRRTALAGCPPQLFERPKQGFELPFERWCREELRSTLEARFRSEKDCLAVGLDPSAMGRLWDAFAEGGPGLYWSRVWAPFALMDWSRRWGVTL